MEYRKTKWELKFEAFKNGSLDNEIKELLRGKIQLSEDMLKAYEEKKHDVVKSIKQEIKILDEKIDTKEKSKKAMDSNKEKIENIIRLKEDLVCESGELLEKLNNLETEVGTIDVDAIKNTLLKNEKLIAKCDLIGVNLVKGKSMEEIAPSLENFKFKYNKDFSKKIIAMRVQIEEQKKEQKEKREAEDQQLSNKEQELIENARKLYDRYEGLGKEANQINERIKTKKARLAPILYLLHWCQRIPILKNFFRNVNIEAMSSGLERLLETKRKEERDAYNQYTIVDRKLAQVRIRRAELKRVLEKDAEGKGDYLSELRCQTNENEVLSGIVIYGDSFKEQLKYQIPNTVHKLTKIQEAGMRGEGQKLGDAR